MLPDDSASRFSSHSSSQSFSQSSSQSSSHSAADLLAAAVAAVPDDGALPADDHRALCARLDLCHFQDEAPAMVFWHPRGYTVYQLLEQAARRQLALDAYREVRTPQLMRRAVWEHSGHWGKFHDGMFACGEGAEEAALKPVSCPGHIQLVRRMAPSWRDLPLRFSELGLVHRNEASGSLHGLMRLRQFTQDDGHIFCTEEQAGAEVERFCRGLPAFYRRFGFSDIAVALSLRPENRIGDDAVWDRAEQILGDVARGLGLPLQLQPGAGAIYGPKLEFQLRDRRARIWQCGTVQLDFVMPQRFDVRYADASGERRHVVMLHRALYGSLERFMGLLLEQHGAALPAWLAPEQVVVVPVTPEEAAQRQRAEEVVAQLVAAGLRARLDDQRESLSRRIALAHHLGVPYVAIVGEREVAAGTVAVRGRDGQWAAAAGAAIEQLAQRCSVEAMAAA
jgi:threonyl-tRNA synthetase